MVYAMNILQMEPFVKHNIKMGLKMAFIKCSRMVLLPAYM